MESRRRTNVGKKNRKRVAFSDDVKGGKSKWEIPSLSELLVKYHKYLLAVGVILSIVFSVFAPPPKFSKEVQYWHDSGYLFKFREHDIHFQDIPRNKAPVLLTPVLLVIHGFPTSSYDWKDLIPKFHERFGRIIIPDLLGFGFSDKPTGYKYSIKEQATMLEELLNHLKINDVHILAHDYGDSVAQELIARADDSKYHLMFNIKSVCLTNGGIIPSQIQLVFIQKVLLTPVLRSIASYITNRFIFRSRLSAVFGANTQPSSQQLHDFYTIIAHKRGNIAMPEVIQYLPERYANEERWVGALKETTIPLHLIYGPLDPINTPEGFLIAYETYVAHSSVSILEGIGHYPQLENEEEFMKAYNTFLDRVEKDFYVL